MKVAPLSAPSKLKLRYNGEESHEVFTYISMTLGNMGDFLGRKPS
jgi:hypothetical protein